jgi:hypothetical protein
VRARDNIELAEKPRKIARRRASGVNSIFADVIEGAGNVITCSVLTRDCLCFGVGLTPYPANYSALGNA